MTVSDASGPKYCNRHGGTEVRLGWGREENGRRGTHAVTHAVRAGLAVATRVVAVRVLAVDLFQLIDLLRAAQ